MDRRDFLKIASAAGLGVVAGGIPFLRSATAQDQFKGPFWIMVHAGGGWDPTSFCDPKGSKGAMDPNPINKSYQASAIESAGPIRYAPVGGNAAFFQKYYKDLLVLNGVDCATNSHDAGTRVTWSGSLLDGRPALAALIAGAKAPTEPMAFITNGGYDATAGVVALTRVGNLDALQRIAFPNKTNPNDANSPQFQSDATVKRIADARYARHQAMLAKQQLPRIKQSMSMLYMARTGQNELQKLTQFLPSGDQLQQAELKRQAQVAIAAFRAGVCACANLSIGGFDTHGDHDNQHIPQLAELFDGVDFIMQELGNYPETANNAIVVMGSDFGRTPHYNDGNGKDHWSITSMMMMGKGIQGGRVIGGTDEDFQNPLEIDPKSLAVSPSGVRITPGMVHQALRKLAGIEASDGAKEYQLPDDALPLFG